MRRWWPLVALVAGTFVLVLDVNIVNVALPDISRSLQASFSQLQWVADIYPLVVAALLLGAGAVADQSGHRTAFVRGCALFGVGSLCCALAPTTTLLIAARALQGVGGAAMFATGAALISVSYAGRDRGVAFGVWAAAASVGSALGPVLGGVITQYWGWRWIFGVNIPVIIAAILLATATISGTPRRPGVRLDVLGIVTFTLSVGGMVFGLIGSGEQGWSSPWRWVPLGAGAVLLGIFILAERHARQPMLDLTLFRRPQFVALIVAGAVTNAAGLAMFPYASVWLQSVLAASPVTAGLMLLPLALACLVVSLVMAPFTHRTPAAWLVGAGLALITLGSLLQGVIHPNSSGWVLTPGLIVAGMGVGLVLPSLASAVMAAVTPDRAGMASGTLNTFRQLGYALGVAVFGAIFTAQTGPQLSRQGVAWGLNNGYRTAAAIGAVALVLVLATARGDRSRRTASRPRAEQAPGRDDATIPTLLGRVTGADGTVIDHAFITLIDGNGRQIDTARTDSAGSYRFLATPSGTYTAVTGARSHHPDATVVNLHHRGQHVDIVLVTRQPAPGRHGGAEVSTASGENVPSAAAAGRHHTRGKGT